MTGKNKRYNLYIAVASNGTITFPLPTAFGHASSDILVIDSLSCFFTATGGTTASYGGLMKTWLTVNATASTAATFSQVSPVAYYQTASTSGCNYGGFVWESVDGLPMWPITATSPYNLSDPGTAPTAYYLRYTFTGAYATGSPVVETFASFHYERPSERR